MQTEAGVSWRNAGLFGYWTELGGEGGAAAAGVAGVGVFEDETAAHDFVFEVDFGAVEVEVGFAVGEDFNSLTFHDFIVFGGGFGEVEDVGEAGAAAAFYADAEGDAVGEALVFDDGFDFLGSGFGEGNGHCGGS